MKSKTIKSIFFTTLFTSLVLLLNNCTDPENPTVPTNDEELITTVKLELTDTLSGQKLNYFFRDLDGEGGNVPSQWDTIKLKSNSFYRCNLVLLNESNPNGIENITNEIQAEQDNHIICYTVSAIQNEIIRTDSSNNLVLGLKSNWKTNSKSSGDITVTLKHQLGIKNGSCDPGETDVEVKFPAKVD